LRDGMAGRAPRAGGPQGGPRLGRGHPGRADGGGAHQRGAAALHTRRPGSLRRRELLLPRCRALRGAALAVTTGTELRHCRVCDEAALADRGVKTMTRDVFGGRRRGLLRGHGTRDPAELRRRWGGRLSLRAFAGFGVLGEAAEILAVGPDCDEAVRWLSQRAKWVFATDPVSEGEPPLNPRRVVVQEMAPTELRYEDGSMDA